MNMQVIGNVLAYSHSGGTIFRDVKDDTWGLETVNNLAFNMAGMLNEIKKKEMDLI